MDSGAISIRPLTSLDELYEAVELQRTYWGNDVESVVPAQMLYTIVGCGGHVIGAFDGGKMVGVLIGLIGTDTAVKDRPAMANLLIASKRMVVLPEYRSAGIGYRLKLAQRDATIQLGIRLVTWTFDPLQSKNAHLNLRKLGGIVKDYQVNAYGTRDETGLSRFGWSDRLKVQWWVTHRRVDERLHGQRSDVTLSQYLDAGAVLINPTSVVDGVTVYPESYNRVNGSFALFEIPRDFDHIVKTEPEIAKGWQNHVREAFLPLLNGGYFVSDFLTGTLDGRARAFYLFSADLGFDFSSPN
jgi:predicted GNAT superfamily acetyltransferase